MKIVLSGTGNMGAQLGQNLIKKGFGIHQLYGRSADKTKKLAEKLGCDFTTSLDSIKKDGDIYIIAVSDKAIQEISEKLKLGNAVVVHTAGSVDMNILMGCSNNYGVIYPLQTISENTEISFSDIPVCIEANNECAMKTIKILADKLSNHVFLVDSEKRKFLHIAGVMVNNFTNFMYSLANELAEKKGFDFEILKPLILETANKVLKNDPKAVQTGPAIRNDVQTISSHINLLNDFPDHQKIYSFVTECMQQYYLKSK